MRTVKIVLQVLLVALAVEAAVLLFWEREFIAAYWTAAGLFILIELRLGFLYPGGERGALVIESVMAGVYLALIGVGLLIGGLAWWVWLALLGRKLINMRRTLRASRWGRHFHFRRKPLLAALIMLGGFWLMYISLFPR